MITSFNEKGLFLYDVFLNRGNTMGLYTLTNHGFNSADCGGVTISDLKEDMSSYNGYYYSLDFILAAMCIMWVVDILAFFFGSMFEDLCLNKWLQGTVITLT